MDAVNPLIAMCALLPILYISAFAHELGHALMAHAMGFAVTSFGLGVGRPFALFSRGRARIYLCRIKPLQGIAFCVPPVIIPLRRRMVPYLAGGVIANTVLALLALALYRWVPWGRSIWHPACAVNAILAVTNLVPFSGRIGKAVLRTDGGQILAVLRDGLIGSPEPQVIQALKTFRDFWQSIGNHTMLRLYILGSAAVYAEMNDIERADALFSELDSLEPSDLLTVQAREAMVRGAIHCAAGRLELAEQALLAADATFQAAGDEGGQLFTAMHRLWIRIARRDLPAAIDDLSTLTTHRPFRRSSWFQASVHAFCVQAQATGSDAAGAERALVSYERMRRRHPSAWRDLRVYRAVAGLRAQNAQWEQAELAYRRAVEAINELARSWPDAEDLREFLVRQSPFLDEARHCYQHLNRAQEAEWLIAPIASPELADQRVADERLRQNRRLVRAGRWALLVDVCCTIGLVMSPTFVRLEPSHPFAIGGIMFVLCTLFAVVILVLQWLIGVIIPRVRSSGGVVAIVLASFPWLALLASLVTLVD